METVPPLVQSAQADFAAAGHSAGTSVQRPSRHGAMKRILLTGMSGTGKSTLIDEFAARGYKAIDTDSDAWSVWVTSVGAGAGGAIEESDWVWREDHIHHLLATEDADVLFVSGCKSNQGQFYSSFDHIVLLSAPTPVIVERLATRTTNPYGKTLEELAQVLGYIRHVEPLLRRGASLEVNTDAPLDWIVATILEHIGERYDHAPLV